MTKAPPQHAFSSENIMKRYPSSMAVYENLVALGWTASLTMDQYAEDIERVLIYPAIDNMPEDVLDILAHDLKVDWYNYDYSLESKRSLIKSSVYVHKFLGTPAAVKAMLSSVFPGSTIEEWFNYGGEPHHFQIVIEMSAAKEVADIKTIIRAVNMVKRLSSWLDGVVYRVNVNLVIQTRKEHWIYEPYMDRDTNVDGTFPWRSEKYHGNDLDLQIQTHLDRSVFPGEPDGTTPWRAEIWQPTDRDVTVETTAEPSVFQSASDRDGDLDGTFPWRAETWKPTDRDITVETMAEASPFHTTEDREGKYTGTDPWRAEKWKHNSTQANVQTIAQPSTYPPEYEGTDPWRAEKWKPTDRDVNVQTESTQDRYQATADRDGKVTGIEPWRAETWKPKDTRADVQTKTDTSAYAGEPEGTTPWRADKAAESATDLQEQTKMDLTPYRTEDDSGLESRSGQGISPIPGMEITGEAESFYYITEYDREDRMDS